jgi:hypothetical protein
LKIRRQRFVPVGLCRLGAGCAAIRHYPILNHRGWAKLPWYQRHGKAPKFSEIRSRRFSPAGF